MDALHHYSQNGKGVNFRWLLTLSPWRFLSSLAFCSSAMDLKKGAMSEQLPNCVSSPRRKVVSGFGLGVMAAFVVLAILFFNTSFRTPVLDPMFQGFNTVGGSKCSLLSWPLSLSGNTAGSSSSSSSIITKVKNPLDFSQKSWKISGETHPGNVPQTGDSSGFGAILEKRNVGNSPENLNNGSLTAGQERNLQKDNAVENSDLGANATSSTSCGERKVAKNTRLGNFSQAMKNGSYTDKEEFDGRKTNQSLHGIPARSTESSNAEKNNVGDDLNLGNRTEMEENVNSYIKEGNSSEHLKSTFSNYKLQNMELMNGSLKDCDIFHGRWVRDDTKLYYPVGSCPYIDRDFDCHLNGRPDNGFLSWKWQPYGCDIPSFNASDFLERLRGKKLVFVGDSLNRNMWESLVCILRHIVMDKKQVYEISGRREFKKKGFYAFRFEDYNCSVDFVSSPFLVRESSFVGRNGSFETLRLDLMDSTNSMYHDADVIVFNTGHWWTHEKTSRGEYYYQEGNHVYPRLKVLEAYKRALVTWGRWVDQNIDGNRTQVVFRGYSVTHFRGGPWNSGGQCHRETEPIYNETYLAKYPSKMRALEHVLQGMRTPVIYLNISRLTDYRKDGHPSIYRMAYKTAEEQAASVHSQDCSHWCLPGVPDTWNELFYASLLKAGRGSWRRS